MSNFLEDGDFEKGVQCGFFTWENIKLSEHDKII